MPTRAELESALINADKAGDREAARKLANALKASPEVSKTDSLIKGVGQGATLGFGDELSGAVSAGMDKLLFSDLYEGQSFSQRYEARRDQRREENKQAQEANPGTYLTGEMVGGLSTGASSMARNGAALTMGQIAKTGAAIGGAGGAGYSEGETIGEVAADTAVGAGAGAAFGVALPAAGAGINRAVTQFSDRALGAVSDTYKPLVDLLKSKGVSLTAAKELGTDWAKALETQLAQVPIGGKPLQLALENSRRTFQREVVKMVGLEDGSDLINRNTLDKMQSMFSRQYKAALGGKQINIASDEFLDDLARVEASHTELVDSQTARRIKSVVDAFLAKAEKQGTLDGDWYQAQRSLFAKRARGNGELADLYADLKRTLDNAFTRAAGNVKGDLDLRFKRFKQLEEVFEGMGGAESSEGFLPLASLARKVSKGGMDRDWEDFIRAGSAVITDKVPNSGTAQRQLLMGIFTGYGMFDPVTAGAILGGSRLASKTLSKGIPMESLRLQGPNIPKTPLTTAPAGIAPVITQ